jgi:type IV pilus assembly protein PilB
VTAKVPLGTILVQRGLVTQDQIEDAIAEQARTSRSLGRVLVSSGAVSEADLVSALAAQAGLEFVDLRDYSIDPTAASTISDQLSRRYQAMPIAWEGTSLVVAMADPSNVLAVDDIRSITGAEVRPVVSTREAIEEAINRAHRLDAEVNDVTSLAVDATDEDEELANVREITEDAPIVKLANLIIRQGVQDRASDIHVEPTEHDVRIRYRIDGVLHEVMRPPKKVQSGLVSRLKIMADLNIAEKRVPQDGRVSATIAGKQVDLRVATLPTVYGEKIVMRVLDKGTSLLDLADLGFLPQTLSRYETMFNKPYGTILVTGPTGSCMSTTLYATLNQLNDPSKNIITVEDPVEYRLPGINQVQINNKAGLTFAAALRTILRADPDILLVGEIRDKETAVIAMEAALTGHLVLSTLHTNDAASTPTRLVEMGLEPYLVSSSVDCVVAQRLIRRLCDRCKIAYFPTSADLSVLGIDTELEDPPEELYQAVGCQACSRTGYNGRFALHEVLMVTDDLKTMIADRAHGEDIKKVAIAQGMTTLRRSGLTHVRLGNTSVEELLRVVA